MRPLFIAAVLTGCQPNFALQDGFSPAPISLFSPPQDSLNSPYLAGAVFDLQLVGDNELDDVTLVSDDERVLVVQALVTRVEDGWTQRTATVRTVGPGQTTLRVRVAGRQRHAVDVTVAQPDRIDVHPIIDVAADVVVDEPFDQPGLQRIDIVEDRAVEFELRPYAGETLLMGTSAVNVIGDDLVAEPGSLRTVDRHPIVAMRALGQSERDAEFTVAGMSVQMPVQPHNAPDDVSIRSLPCDVTGSQTGRCYSVVQATLDDGNPVFGVFPTWSTDAGDGWQSVQPGDVFSYSIPTPDQVRNQLNVPITLQVGDQTFTEELAVVGRNVAESTTTFSVEHSNDIRGCSYTGGPSMWFGAAGLVLLFSRRREGRRKECEPPASRVRPD